MSRRIRYTVDGRIVPPGELIRTARGWAEPAPTHCPAGHPLTGRALVGWIPCPGAGRTGHRTHECPECGEIHYRPPLDEPLCDCERRTGRLPRTD
ncbi:hypothetical protein AB0H76_30790 [Nocardia sp. NPDC050712]|uniref:hypothetical protein n=1 Tax=Nocardia sp. NPDC050712 TaxID=3155518 RepID=UPI0033FC26DF